MAAQTSAGKARGERRESSSGIIELGSLCCSAGSLRPDAAMIRLATNHCPCARRTRHTRHFIPTEMRCNDLFLSFCRVVLLGLLICLWSCDRDLFGSDSKEIAQGY